MSGSYNDHKCKGTHPGGEDFSSQNGNNMMEINELGIFFSAFSLFPFLFSLCERYRVRKKRMKGWGGVKISAESLFCFCGPACLFKVDRKAGRKKRIVVVVVWGGGFAGR